MDLLDRLKIDVPVVQAGMGGGVAGVDLVTSVAAAGALGTLGLCEPGRIRGAVRRLHDLAPDRALAVNLLMPFVHKRHVQACIQEGVGAVALFYGGSAALVRELQDHDVVVMAQVGDEAGAREALGWGVDALIAQGIEAGGHLLGTMSSTEFLELALGLAGSTPVLVAGGIATHADVARALDLGAKAAVAGTRFLLTHEAAAHPAYKQRVLDADATVETTLFSFGWPARHRVAGNAATRRWTDPTGAPRPWLAATLARTAPIGRLIPDQAARQLPRLHGAQRVGVPVLTPAPPLAGSPEAVVDETPLYAGDTALRIDSLCSAREAVDLLAGQGWLAG